MSREGSAIARLDTKLIGDIDEDKSARDQARDSMREAGLPPGVDIAQIEARAAVGKYAALHAAGNVMSSGLLYRDMMEKMAAILFADLQKAKNPRERVSIAESLNRIITNHAALATVELKVVEITAHSQKKRRHNSLAPQINSEHTYVVMKEEPKEVADVQIKVHPTKQ